MKARTQASPTASATSSLSALKKAMAAIGVTPPGHFVLDGTLKKFSARKDRAPKGWYIGWSHPRPIVIWGHWVLSDIKHTWRGDPDRPLNEVETAEEVQQRRHALGQYYECRRNVQRSARRRAAEEWEAAKPARHHAYLRRKAIQGTGLRESGGKLLVPLVNSRGHLTSLQRIERDGEKRFLAGGRVRGRFAWASPIADEPETLVVAEGYATARAIFESTGGPTVAALSAGNLKFVARALRKRYPSADLVIAGDDDLEKERETGRNRGRDAARTAALDVGGRLALPDFSGHVDRGSDFNDLRSLEGCSAVVESIQKASAPRLWPPRPPQASHAATDLANGGRLVRQAADVMFVQGDRWYSWDGIWRPDDQGIHGLANRVGTQVSEEAAAMRRCATTAEDLTENARAEMLATAEKLSRWARTSERESNIQSTIKVARRVLTVPLSDLDADPWLLGCPSGAVDLRTGRLRTTGRTDFVTRCGGCAFDPTAKAPRWAEFVDEVFADDPKKAKFVQRFLGYCLLGGKPEQVLGIFVGTGANGKTTLLNTVQHVMGDYAITAASGLLTHARGERHPTDLADLRGRRLVVCTESPRGGRLDEERVKAITGTDRIRARKMGKDFFEFVPSHQLILQTNHLPEVRDTDWAFWRRVRVVEFTRTFKGATIDRDLESRLRKEASGILNWLIAGVAEYLTRGLKAPKAVRTATERYRHSEDRVEEFLRSRFKRAPGLRTDTKVLLQTYAEWCKSRGVQELPKAELFQRLREGGLTPSRTKQKRYWVGLALSGG